MKFNDLSREEEVNSLSISGVLMTSPAYKKTAAGREFLQLMIGVNYKDKRRNGVLYPANSKFLVFFWDEEIIAYARKRNLRKLSRVNIEGAVQTNKIKSKKYPKSDVLMFKGRRLEVDNYIETRIEAEDIKQKFLNKIRNEIR